MLSSIAIYKQNHVCPLSQQRKDPNQYFVLGSAICKEALQIAEKRETKGKGEKEKYTHLNAEFQKIARRDKKAFLSESEVAQSCPTVCHPMHCRPPENRGKQ